MDTTVITPEWVKNWLIAYRELDKDIDNQIERLERLTNKMESVGAQQITDMPRSPSHDPDKFSILLSKKEVLEQSIRDSIAERDRCRTFIETAIRSLRSANERAVIRMRYIDGSSWNDVNEMLYGMRDDFDEKETSYLRMVSYSHKHAIEHLTGKLCQRQIPEFVYEVL